MRADQSSEVLEELLVEAVQKAESSFTHQSVTFGNIAVQMIAASNPAFIGILIKADNANTGTVYVGNSGAVTAGTVPATDGFQLGAGESTCIPVDNANKIFLIATGAGQRVFWVAV